MLISEKMYESQSTISNVRKLISFGFITLFLVNTLLLEVTSFIHVASFSFYILSLGVTYAKSHPSKHIKFVFAAFLMDIALVLILELSRSAINSSLGPELGILQLTHVLCSVVAILLYIVVIPIGFLNRRANADFKLHRILGKLAYTSRFLGLIFMYSFL